METEKEEGSSNVNKEGKGFERDSQVSRIEKERKKKDPVNCLQRQFPENFLNQLFSLLESYKIILRIL